MDAKRYFRLLVILAILFAAESTLANQDSYELFEVGGKPVGTETLIGLTNLCLVIDVSDVKQLNNKFDEHQLYLDVQQMVREANIRTLLPQEIKKTKGMPILRIEVRAKIVGGGSCVYGLSVDLLQTVTLVRDPNAVCLTTTWYIPHLIGYVPTDELDDVIKRLVKDGIKAFRMEHLEANLPTSIATSSLQEMASHMTEQERQELTKKLQEMKENLLKAAINGYKKRIRITTGAEREEAERALKHFEKEYEEWKRSRESDN